MLKELYQYRDLVLYLVGRELKVRYRRSMIGFLWTMLQPLLTMLVLYAVFSTLFRFNLRNYPVYVLAGLLFWNFFQQSIIASMNSLKANAVLLQKLPVPYSVFPVATVLSGLVNLLLALFPVLVLSDRHRPSHDPGPAVSPRFHPVGRAVHARDGAAVWRRWRSSSATSSSWWGW